MPSASERLDKKKKVKIRTYMCHRVSELREIV